MEAIVCFLTPEDLAVVNKGAGVPVSVAPSSMDDASLPWIGLDNEASLDHISELLTFDIIDVSHVNNVHGLYSPSHGILRATHNCW